MPNKIFETILLRKIETLVSTFVEDSQSIFYSENSKIFDPGEYGRYRENSVKDLLQQITKYKVSDGFIITATDKKSTQCDIILCSMIILISLFSKKI